MKILTPVSSKPRYGCPFYGFFAYNGMMMDQRGNQCAVITESYSPCHMQMKKQIPDWNKCPFNHEESQCAISKVENVCRVFPKEFHPRGQSSWRGIILKEWIKYIMSDKVKRPT